MKKLTQILQTLLNSFRNNNHSRYRVIEIFQDEHEDYFATIQLTGKNQVMQMKTEDILSNDSLTDSFSPRDIRTLTYLGYLSINSPKYRILAQRLSEKDSRLLFAVQEKGKSTVTMKTADEISNDKEVIHNLDQKDAHLVGFAKGSENIVNEKRQLEQARKLIDKNASES